ncbi:MAG: hypothetical protein Q8P55_02455, partial [bacterium]|nr:hypothetical protein [bacterium]
MKRKYLAFLFIGLGIFSLVLAVMFFLRGDVEEQESPEVSGDIIPPVTAVFSPEDKSWHATGVLATILDSDLGSGFTEKLGCQYIIQDLGTGEAQGGVRPCERVQVFIPVGEGKTCSSTFEAGSSDGRCLLSSKAVDKAGNESSWESAVFLIDFTPPVVGKVSLPPIVQPGEERFIEAEASDNGKITGCGFFVDGKAVEKETSLSPLPCENEETCTISLSYAFSEPGDHTAFFACIDSAGNIAGGRTASFLVFINKAPEISSCRVLPTKGNQSTL